MTQINIPVELKLIEPPELARAIESDLNKKDDKELFFQFMASGSGVKNGSS